MCIVLKSWFFRKFLYKLLNTKTVKPLNLFISSFLIHLIYTYVSSI